MARGSINSGTGVTDQQERFAIEFVKTGRPLVAYGRSYNPEKMSKAAQSVEANKLINNPKVALRIERYRKIAEKALEVDVQEVARMMARVAKFDIRDCFDDEGNALPPHELPENVALAMGSIEVIEEYAGRGKDRELVGYVKKFKATERNGAVRMLGQWKRMLTERVEVVDPTNLKHLTNEELDARIEEDERVLEQMKRARGRKVIPKKAEKPRARARA